MLTQERLKEVLEYSPFLGLFWRIKATSKSVKVGNVAGSRRRNGYVEMSIDGRRYYAHRLAFLYMTGSFPKNQVDHIDGDPSNNRWKNLREATGSENMCNRHKIQSNNKSGVTGVNWIARTGKWRSMICINGKQTHLGYFIDKKDAINARRKAEIDYYGEFSPNKEKSE